MENNFDYNRFKNVFAKDLLSLWPSFGLTMLIIMLLPTATNLLAWAVRQPTPPELRAMAINMSVVLAVVMAPSRIYKYCNTPNLGIHFAMLPASKKEKYWSMMLMTAVVVPIAAFAGMLLLDILQSMLFGSYCPWIFDLFATYDFTTSKAIWMLSIDVTTLYAIAATFFFTATFFKKHKVLLTLLWAFILHYAFVLIGIVLTLAGVSWIERHPTVATGDTGLFSIFQNMSEDAIMSGLLYGYLLLMLLWAAAFYAGAYYRLKHMKY